jgi:hypothetical protein
MERQGDIVLDLTEQDAGVDGALPQGLPDLGGVDTRESSDLGEPSEIDRTLKKRGGRAISPIWEILTNDIHPQTRINSPCKHCKETVFHHRKSECAERHLLQCKPFVKSMMSIDVLDRPTWFRSKRSKTTLSKTSSSQQSMRNYALPPLSHAAKIKFQQTIALHYYLTGTAFQRIEDDTLAKAIALLRPDAGLLPSRKMLSGPLLDKNYNHLKKISDAHLARKLSFFCLATDGWSNVLNEPIVNYIAISPNTTIFLESISTGEQSHSSNWIASDLIRIIEKYPNTSFSGVVTDNTSANKNAWSQLKTKYPDLFFQGCTSHGLHLLVKDVFAATKTKRNGGSSEAEYPDGYPFEDLLNFANDCKDIVKFFHNHHVVKAVLSKMQNEAGVVSLAKPAATRSTDRNYVYISQLI